MGFLILSVATMVAAAQTYTVLHRFQFANGAFPYGGLVSDPSGTLYGTTFEGGTLNGTVFKLDKSGETVLHSFQGATDGFNPQASLIRDAEGNLYGTTTYGGTYGLGTVFKMTATGQETILYSFTGYADGSQPVAGVIQDSAGNLYGTTQYGGINAVPGSNQSFGVVYRVDPSGKETVLYGFTGKADGANPQAGVIRDSAGNLYGATYSGGDLSTCDGFGCGVVFKLDTGGAQTVLHRFTGTPDGANPIAGLIAGSEGNLYGTTAHGGDVCVNPSGCGTVFKLDKSGETALYRFKGTPDGEAPQAGLIMDAAGNLYGTTRGGGASGYGTVFKMDTAGTETLLYSFSFGADGNRPQAGLFMDSTGNLYGTTVGGGGSSEGVVFKLKP